MDREEWGNSVVVLLFCCLGFFVVVVLIFSVFLFIRLWGENCTFDEAPRDMV